MMQLQMLLILQVIVILSSPLYAYPIYGTKRYGRSTAHRVASPQWAPYQMVRTQRYPVNYYELYPYSQSYPDDYYYPQDSYPLYYPPARTSKYEVYQAVLPYYYGDRPIQRPYYGGYDDPVVDLQEEMMQEDDMDETKPVGHEMLYENDDSNDDNLDDVNAAFLQNLIMSQMYKDSVDNQKSYYDQYPYADYYPSEDSFGTLENTPRSNQKSSFYQEDEDVRELKQLVKPKSKSRPSSDDIYWYQRNNHRTPKLKTNYEEKRDVTNNNVHTFKERKPVIKPGVTTSSPAAITSSSTTVSAPKSSEPRREVRGQKEEVLMRPATPVRHPFSGPVLEMMSKGEEVERKRTPSVYDTIKHMLDMEKSLENKYGADEIRPHMKKRIITSEMDLAHQLSVLKKSQ